MEVGIAQPIGGDAVECWRRNDAAEGRWRAEAHVIGDDEEDVGRALRRHHPRWPRRFGLRRIEADLSLERLRRGRQVAAVDGRSCGGRTRCAGTLWRKTIRPQREQHRDSDESAWSKPERGGQMYSDHGNLRARAL